VPPSYAAAEAYVDALSEFGSSAGVSVCRWSSAYGVVFVLSPIAYDIGRTSTAVSGGPTTACDPPALARRITARCKYYFLVALDGRCNVNVDATQTNTLSICIPLGVSKHTRNEEWSADNANFG
jgi:hypothetical protein